MNGTTTPAKRPSPLVTCDVCQEEFPLTEERLTAIKVTLEKQGIKPKEVTLTMLECPACKMQYPVAIDDDETLGMIHEIKVLQKRRVLLQQKNQRVSSHVHKKYHVLEHNLSFKRKYLASEYNRSFYQAADGKKQLDFHYHG